MKTYFLKTYGCQMNKHDSERIAGVLEAGGFQKSQETTDADLVVFYTCCVRQSADEKFYGQLNSYKYKKGAAIAVGGCLAQKEKAQLIKRFKQIDLVFGTQNLSKLAGLINRLNGASISDTRITTGFNSDLPAKRQSKHKAWVAVNRGCNNHCTYCIVPFVRGSETSRPVKEVEKEIKTLVGKGVADITLLGQNVNSYGLDLYGKPYFANLLQKIAAQGVKRLRFTTSHPKDLGQDIVKTIRDNHNICQHIHLPVQSGSSLVLKKMGRRYSKEHYLKLIDMIRNHLPAASITTDIMVGFPAETEEDFTHTLDVVNKAQFDQAFTFIYSKREGTPAAKMEGQLAYKIKLGRFKRLVELQNEISLAKNKMLVGKEEEVLVDGPAKKNTNMLSGRTKTNKLVHFPANESFTTSLISVKIIEAKPYFLTGKIVG